MIEHPSEIHGISMEREIHDLIYDEFRKLQNGYQLSRKKISQMIRDTAMFVTEQLRQGGIENPVHLRTLTRKRLQIILFHQNIIPNPWPSGQNQKTGVLSGPTHEMQKKRCEELVDGQEKAIFHGEVREKMLALVRETLKKKKPADVWNSEGIQKPVPLTAQQLNDLVTQFIFWTVQHDSRFTPFDQFVLLVMLYFDANPEDAVKKLRTIRQEAKTKQEKEKDIYRRTEDDVTAAYAKLEEFFGNRAEETLMPFLDKADFNDASNEALLSDADKLDSAIEEFEHNALPREKTGERLQALQVKHFPVPKTPMERFLSRIDVILLQHGSLTARNCKLLSYMPLIRQRIFRGSNRAMAARLQLSDKLSQVVGDTIGQIIERLALIDVKKAPTTYMLRWINSRSRDSLQTQELIRIPRKVHETMAYLNRNPDATDQDILEHFNKQKSGKKKGKNISPEAVHLARNLLVRKPPASLDEPFGGEKDNTRTRYDVLERKSQARNDPESTKILEEKLELIRRAIALLSPRDKIILNRWLTESDENGNPTDSKPPLESLAAATGVTRQRLQQIEKGLMKALSKKKPVKTREPISKNPRSRFKYKMNPLDRIVVTVTEGFEAWCNAQNFTPFQRYLLRLYLGLEETVGFRRMRTDNIVRYLQASHNQRDGKLWTSEKIRDFLNSARERLWARLCDLPEEQWFIQFTPRARYIEDARVLIADARQIIL